MAGDDKTDNTKIQQRTPQTTIPTTTPITGEPPERQRRAAAGSLGGVPAGMVKVTVKHTAPLGLPPINRERAKLLEKTIERDHLDRFLQPGENTIPADHWNAVKDESPVRNWIEEGMLYEGANRDAKAEPSGETFRESLNTLSEDEAKRYIEASDNAAQLAKWADTERRPAVRDAIQRRMDAIGGVK